MRSHISRGDRAARRRARCPRRCWSIWDRVHERHDVVLVDQRGTGGSNALECPEPTGPIDTDAERKSYVDSCLAALKGDPAQYGTRAAMDDLDAVRAALGYRTLDVYGTSYGATAAQVYLERHPGSVRTMILDSGSFLDVPFFSRYAENGERALDQIVKRCSAQPSCTSTFPHWRDDLDSLIAKWNEAPVLLPTSDTITGDGLAGVVQQMTLVSSAASYIPLVVSRAAVGDYGPLSHYAVSGELTRSMMYWSIMCNEPWVGLDSTGPWHSYLDGATTGQLALSRAVCGYLPVRAEAPSDWTRPQSPRSAARARRGRRPARPDRQPPRTSPGAPEQSRGDRARPGTRGRPVRLSRRARRTLRRPRHSERPRHELRRQDAAHAARNPLAHTKSERT